MLTNEKNKSGSSMFDRYVGLGKKMVNAKYSLLYSMRPSVREMLQRNSAYKDSYSGEKCYILGNGPSLNDIDLERLNGKYTFTVNEFYKHCNELTSTFHVMIDPGYFSEKHKEYYEYVSEKTNLITDYRAAGRIIDSDSAICVCADIMENTFVSVDMSKRMTGCSNVVLMAIQCALYMGFKEIYLLGCDHNYFLTLREQHFYDVKEPDPTKSRRRLGYEFIGSGGIFLHHYALDDFSRVNGSVIYNSTRGSFIDAYEFKDLPELYYRNET